MSLLRRLHGKKSVDIDDLRTDIAENITGIISSFAPILKERITKDLSVKNTILTIGLRNTMRYQKKFQGNFVFEEIIELIKRFEPRLHDVEIEENPNTSNTNLFEFKIKGITQINGDEDIVLFDSYLDFGANVFRVRKSNFV